MKLLDGVSAAATLSDCGTYRYSLTRSWDMTRDQVLWIMLNPSTADADADDPTVRRCQSFARDWGYGGIVVVNLFALRATDPRELSYHRAPIGPHNDDVIVGMLDTKSIALAIAAWGAHGGLRYRDAEVIKLAHTADRTLEAVGLTHKGQPRHPLYVRGDAKRVFYR